jgi:3-oxoacyl-[acyl-carrier protein] reductase
MKFQNKIAVVTGGTRGIGYQIVKKLADEGAKVIALSKGGRFAGESGLVNQSSSLHENSIMVLKADISAKSEVDQAFKKIYDQFGRIDILVNSAGICAVCKMMEITEAQWDEMMAVNLKGVFLCCQAVYNNMANQKYGKIINITSVAGKIGGNFIGAHYSVSKAGVMMLTKQLAKDLAPYKVNVNAIAPALTDTDMTGYYTDTQLQIAIKGIPLGRIGFPEDIANATLFLASDEAAFITGEILDVNGGVMMD